MASKTPSSRQTEPPKDMLDVEDALDQILSLVDVMPPESKPLAETFGQVLAQDLVAPFDIPPLDNTAMDGYAVQAADTSPAGSDESDEKTVRLRVVGELAAGYIYDGQLGPGEAIRIMTGAPIPGGADAIVPFEETDEEGKRAPGQDQPDAVDTVGILKAANLGANVRPRGEDVRTGQTILTRGAIMRGAEIAVAASLGIDQVQVIRRPRIAILSTGDELLVPGQPPEPGKIYDSNSYGLAAQVREYGGDPQPQGIAQDTVAALTAKVHTALVDADLLVTSAGVSRGDFDVVKEVLVNEGQVHFWTVKMKPGKPLAFGKFEAPDGRQVPHIGLPGNPVSSLLAFELFGRPAIHKMLGRKPQPRPMLRAITDDAIINSDGRRIYARVTVAQEDDGRWHAQLTGKQSSGILTSMAYANAFAICPDDVPEVPAGAEVDVLMVDWDHPAE
jgi:molybdopterin molybdotransferase